MLEVLIIEPHLLYQSALFELLKRVINFRVLAPLETIDSTEIPANAQPDVILLRRGQDLDGNETITWINQLRLQWPSVAILVMGTPGFMEARMTERMDRVHWISRRTSNESIIEAVQLLGIGSSPISNTVTDTPAEQFRRKYALTSVELRLLQGVVAGWSMEDLAGALRLRLATLRATLNNLMEKLGAYTEWGLRRIAEKYQIPALAF